MLRRRHWALFGSAPAAAALLAHGCFARESGELRRQTDDDAGTPPPVFAESGPADTRFELPVTDPHAVLGVDPPHGPFVGGTLAIVRGYGFQSDVRVWFGSTEVAVTNVVPIDPSRVQVVAPPGAAGAADVSVQNGDDASTRRTLIGGYFYDAFYAEPASGPTSGGTIITIHGFETHWDDQTAVTIDLLPCPVQQVLSPTELTCTTPPNAAGVKPMRVTTGDGQSVDVLDAFTYGDSDNGFKGGLSGQPLGSELRVIALDSYAGIPIAGASVIVGDDISSAIVTKTDSKGVAVVSGTNLGPTRSVTVAAKCHQPTTFVDVPVDTVTAYLDPVLSPACGSGDPPPVGGTPGATSTIEGELVWKGNSQEFKRDGWTNVPAPASDDEQLVAYVFRPASDATRNFDLPPAADAVTPYSPGQTGYAFSMTATPGNLTLYALAGIENRTFVPPMFTAYAMGMVRGVSAKPASTTANVYINIDVELDQALTLNAVGPTPTARGPDHLDASAAVRVSDQGYVILPIGRQTRLLPVTEPFEFVGLPSLTGSLSGTQYVATASASTGQLNGEPRSVVGLIATTTTSQSLSLDQFVEVPVLNQPQLNSAWNGTDLGVSAPAGGASVELAVFEVDSGGGLINWLIAVPGDKTAILVPDLAALGSDLSLVPGPITISVTRAHIDGFYYGSLRYRQLDKRGWNAYATDSFFAHL